MLKTLDTNTVEKEVAFTPFFKVPNKQESERESVAYNYSDLRPTWSEFSFSFFFTIMMQSGDWG